MSSRTDDHPDIIDLGPEAVTDHDKPQPTPESAAGPADRSRAIPSKAALLAVALLAAAILGAWLYKDYLWQFLPNDELSALATRTKELEESNAALSEQLAVLQRLADQLKTDMDADEAAIAAASSAAKAASDSVASLSGRVDNISKEVTDTSGRVQALSDRLANLPPASAPGQAEAFLSADALRRLEALEKDVASLKASRGSAGSEKDTALLSQSLSDLKAKIASGAGFADEYDRISRLVPAAPGLDVLRRHAASGLPDAKGLAKELAQLSATFPSAHDAALPAGSDDSWTGWALDQLSNLITIRMAGSPDWKRNAEAAIALAESGDLPQAIERLSAVDATRPPGLQQWLERASARQELENSLKAVEEAVLRVIAARG